MKAKKIEPVPAVLTAEELLREKGLTRDEWNEMVRREIERVASDDSLSKEQKDARIGRLFGTMIVERDGGPRFVAELIFRSLVENAGKEDVGGGVND